MPYSSLKPLALIGMLAGLAMAAQIAQATPIHFDESLSGDLGEQPSGDFYFDRGDNTISGTTHFGVNLPGRPRFDIDADSFAFTLPSGSRLDGIWVSFATTSFNAVKANEELRLCAGIGVCDSDLTDLIGTQTESFLDASPLAVDFGYSSLGAGTYSIVPAGLGIAPLDVSVGIESWSTDYTWTFRVVDVAEPGVAFVFLSGLLLIVNLTRRKFG
jgi:hypothetical protein